MKIGIQELLLIFIVALIVLGPDKLPVYARRLGEGLREFRRFSSDATKDIHDSIVEPLEEAQRPLREALEPITTLEKEIKGEVAGIQKSISDIGKPVKKETAPDSPQAGGTDTTDMDDTQAVRTDTADTDDVQAIRTDIADAAAPVSEGAPAPNTHTLDL